MPQQKKIKLKKSAVQNNLPFYQQPVLHVVGYTVLSVFHQHEL